MAITRLAQLNLLFYHPLAKLGRLQNSASGAFMGCNKQAAWVAVEKVKEERQLNKICITQIAMP